MVEKRRVGISAWVARNSVWLLQMQVDSTPGREIGVGVSRNGRHPDNGRGGESLQDTVVIFSSQKAVAAKEA